MPGAESDAVIRPDLLEGAKAGTRKVRMSLCGRLLAPGVLACSVGKPDRADESSCPLAYAVSAAGAALGDASAANAFADALGA